METKHIKSELLYIEEHRSCQNYMTTIETGFKYLEFAKNAAFEEDNTTKNYLLFFLKGDFTISCNQFHNKLFHAGEMILNQGQQSNLFKAINSGKLGNANNSSLSSTVTTKVRAKDIILAINNELKSQGKKTIS